MSEQLDKAIAAAREALEYYYASEQDGVSPDALRDLLAALDAARGQAVAYQTPHLISFKNVERTSCPPEAQAELEGEVSWGLSLFGDGRPVTDKHGVTHYPTPLYAAPPAAADADEDAYVIERMGKLLAEIAIIVNGTEPHDTLWSYHDLPDKVRALKKAPPAAAASADGMLPDALVPHAKEWYRLCERRFAVDRITISGKLAEAIVAALSTQAPPAAAVPPGYALVPVEPTINMLQAALDLSRKHGNLIPLAREYHIAEILWRAMLAAAERKGGES